jgi:hypothetical protein
MFSVITNVYNKKTKGPTLMEVFTVTGKTEKRFLTARDVRIVHHEWHDIQRYDIQVLVTHASTWVLRYSSVLQWSVLLGQRGDVTVVGRTNDGTYCVRPTIVTWPHYYWHVSLQQWRIWMHPCWRVCGKNLNIVSMCAVSPLSIDFENRPSLTISVLC